MLMDSACFWLEEMGVGGGMMKAMHLYVRGESFYICNYMVN